ncbi:MAG TPA: hypothetical protein PKD49_13225 [Hyphomicrobium sp.]|nr:hypothetical protein [Hyphomicrobium sp.]
MGQAHHQCEKLGLVVGLCPDTAVYLKLACVADASGLLPGALRAAGKVAALHAINDRMARSGGVLPEAWRERMVPLNTLDHEPYFASDDEPLLTACFSCLSTIPAGGAPWQGSWRSDTMGEVLRALEAGAILLAVEAHSVEEQRSWARTLLKCGCAFVQTHDDAICRKGTH